jgi:hypothetical protein
MTDRDLRLNGLFKQSSRLVLEEHSHCEVPAGCGGVVLRWRLRSLIPLNLFVQATCKLGFFIDAALPDTGRPLLTPGSHQLALQLTEVPPSGANFVLAGIIDLEDLPGRQRHRLAPLLSREDGTWLCSSEELIGSGWMRRDFDDSAWTAMSAASMPAEEADRYQCRQALEAGATPLGTPAPQSTLYVRKKFVLEEGE